MIVYTVYACVYLCVHVSVLMSGVCVKLEYAGKEFNLIKGITSFYNQLILNNTIFYSNPALLASYNIYLQNWF